jgi:hypothetical protein
MLLDLDNSFEGIARRVAELRRDGDSYSASLADMLEAMLHSVDLLDEAVRITTKPASLGLLADAPLRA